MGNVRIPNPHERLSGLWYLKCLVVQGTVSFFPGILRRCRGQCMKLNQVDPALVTEFDIFTMMHPRFRPQLSALVMGVFLPAAAYSQTTINLSSGTQTYVSLQSTTVQMSGSSELRLTSATPLTGSTINLTSENSWLFLTGIRPDTVVTSYLSQIQVNGAPAVVDTNVRIVEYGLGSIVIPHSANYTPLIGYAGAGFTGDSMAFGMNTYYTSSGVGPGGVTLPVIALGTMDRAMSSFKLKRGYMATISAKPDGTGASQNYIAQDGDIEVGLLPTNLNNAVQFVRVFPWRWVAKKGACDVAPDLLNTTWWYNWNNSNESIPNREYAPTWQQPFWPGQPTNRTTVTHHLGLNEPNGSDQDAYKNLSPPGSVDAAVAIWPAQLASGLRAGSPAVTDGGYSWISSFAAGVDAAGNRMDFVPIHYYRASNNDPATAAANMYAFLKSVHDVVKRPMWVTEFNNGANWTTGTDPTLAQNAACIEAMIKMMDETPWIERYAVYSAVEEVRQMVVSGTNPVQLTQAGTMYRDHVSPLSYIQAVPATGGAWCCPLDL
jgi:Glycosyl hydrolase catalytic core